MNVGKQPVGLAIAPVSVVVLWYTSISAALLAQLGNGHGC